jgi:hypothetical protein
MPVVTANSTLYGVDAEGRPCRILAAPGQGAAERLLHDVLRGGQVTGVRVQLDRPGGEVRRVETVEIDAWERFDGHLAGAA